MTPDSAPPEDRRAVHGRALCRAIAGFHALGWCRGTSGNYSVCQERAPLRLLITRSGRDKGRLGLDDLMLVDEAGQPADGDDGRPSAETLLHCTLATERGAGSVLHTHSVAGTLLGEHFLDAGGFTISGYEMQKGFEGVDTHEAEVFVPVLANDQDMVRLSAALRASLADHPRQPGFLIAGHGLYTWGADLATALRQVEIFEFLFECLARRTRFTPYDG